MPEPKSNWEAIDWAMQKMLSYPIELRQQIFDETGDEAVEIVEGLVKNLSDHMGKGGEKGAVSLLLWKSFFKNGFSEEAFSRLVDTAHRFTITEAVYTRERKEMPEISGIEGIKKAIETFDEEASVYIKEQFQRMWNEE